MVGQDMQFLSQANDWILDHQGILAVVSIPVFGMLFAEIVSILTTRMNLKAHKADREMQARVWTLEHKKQRVSEFRSLIVEFSALTFAFDFDLKNGISSGEPGKKSKEEIAQMTKDVIRLIAEANFQAGLVDTEYEKLTEAMWYEIAEIGGAGHDEKREPNERFAAIGSRIIERLEQRITAEGESLANDERKR